MPPPDFFKSYYNPNQTIKSILNKSVALNNQKFLQDIHLNKNIYFQIDSYIKIKTKKVFMDMPLIYRNMKDHLLSFKKFRNKPITFESLNFSFYEKFVDFLTYDYVFSRRKDNPVGLKTNTVGKTINLFKTFLKDRIKKGLIPVYDMDDWIVFRVEADAVYLSIK